MSHVGWGDDCIFMCHASWGLNFGWSVYLRDTWRELVVGGGGLHRQTCGHNFGLGDFQVKTYADLV
jgi:hypothetical protein